MSNFSLLTALQVVEKTMAYTMYRQFIWFGICFAYLLATIIGAGTALALNAVGIKFTGLATLGALAGLIGCGYLLNLARRDIFVPVRAGHAVAIVEHMKGHELPGGRAQIDYAKALVAERFGGNGQLYQLDLRIKDVIRLLLLDYLGLDKKAKLSGQGWVAGAVRGAIGHLLSYVDETVLAFHLRTDAGNANASARDALVLMAQNRAALFKLVLILFLFVYGGLFAAFYLLLTPAGWVTDLFPVPIDYWGWVFAMVFAWGIKATFFDSVALAALIQVFFKTAENQQPETEWGGLLRELSSSFRQIADEA